MVHKITQRFEPVIITQIINDYEAGIPAAQMTTDLPRSSRLKDVFEVCESS